VYERMCVSRSPSLSLCVVVCVCMSVVGDQVGERVGGWVSIVCMSVLIV